MFYFGHHGPAGARGQGHDPVADGEGRATGGDQLSLPRRPRDCHASRHRRIELCHIPIQTFPYSVVWAKARRKAGVAEWATPHDLCHYFASALVRSGASVKVVQAHLGHASAKTTLEVYGHLFPDEEDRTRAAIDAELGSPASSPRHNGVSRN